MTRFDSRTGRAWEALGAYGRASDGRVKLPDGRACQMNETERVGHAIDALKRRSVLPPECGDAAPMSPARGAFRVSDGQALYPDGVDGWVSRRAGYMGRKTAHVSDVFDVMDAQAARARRDAPLGPSHKAMARFYRDLFERHACAGIKLSSLEGIGGGSSGFMDAVLEDGRLLDLLRRRIGTGAAMVVRRVRPSSSGSRVTLFDRMIVDGVALNDMTLDDVLRRYGWVRNGKTRAAVREALAAALDRMTGPVRGGITAAAFGDGPRSIMGE